MEPDWQRKFYEMDQIAGQDAPSPDPQSPTTLEKFVQNTFEPPQFLPEGTFVAIAADGQYLGSTELADASGGEHFTTPFTCVLHLRASRLSPPRHLNMMRLASSPTTRPPSDTWRKELISGRRPASRYCESTSVGHQLKLAWTLSSIYLDC